MLLIHRSQKLLKLIINIRHMLAILTEFFCQCSFYFKIKTLHKYCLTKYLQRFSRSVILFWHCDKSIPH